MQSTLRSVLPVGSVAVIALSTVLIMGAPAFADHIIDEDCDGTPYPNSFQVFGFDVETPDSSISGEVSGMESSGVACGTILHIDEFGWCGPSGQDPPQGYESLNVRLEMKLPEGVEINPTANLPDGAYVGIAPGRAAICADQGQSTILRGSAVVRAKQDIAGTDCPVEAIACYEGTSSFQGYPGLSYSWVTQDENERLTMTTGPMHIYAPVFAIGGFTKFGVRLCAYAGSPADEDCGDISQPWLVKNGAPSVPGCLNDKGIFEALITNYRGDETTTPVGACVPWLPVPEIVTDPACEPHLGEFGLFDFEVDTPDSHIAWAVSGVTINMLSCGSEITNTSRFFDQNGSGTLVDRFEIVEPPGVDVARTADMTDDAFVGTASVNVLSWDRFAYYPIFASDITLELRVDQSEGTDCPAGTTACYKGTSTGGDISGHNWSWVTEDSGRFTLTIGGYYNDDFEGTPAGITKINEFALCGYVGDPFGSSCGSGS